MAISETSGVIQRFRSAVLLREGAGLTDRQLLDDYLIRREETALAALVRRHGSMIWGVCRRILGNHHDAEDAFQATLLVFVRRAASIASPELLANWLFSVARRTAKKAKANVAKRMARERQVTEMPEPPMREQSLWNDLKPLLDRELSRLSEKHRIAVVLCDLEGQTRKAAARQLGVPEGTLASWLARGRLKLAKRLTRSGVKVSGGLLATMLASNAASAVAPTFLVVSTINAASVYAGAETATTEVLSAKVNTLTEGMLKTMLMTKLNIATVALLVVGLLGAGVGSSLCKAPANTTGETAPAEPKKKTDEKGDVKIEGLVDGKKIQPESKSVVPGTEAAAKILAASNLVDNLTDFMRPGQEIDKLRWQEQVAAGIENKRPHLRMHFEKPRQIEGKLNGQKAKFGVSEVVFFDPGANGPICLWVRDGEKYYFANQIAGHEDLVKWLDKILER